VPDCPTCGASAEPGQEYCLECGARIPAGRSVISTVGRAWRRRLRWYPGDWLPVVLALLVVAALATAAAVYAAQGDEEATQGRTVVATSPPDVTTTEADTGSTETAPVASVPTQATTTATQPVDGAGPGSPVEWPADQDGFTVVLASMPISGGREVALRNARSAIRSGLEEVGVLDSEAFASLHPGYYVVFAGVYPNLEEAQNAVPDARDAGFANAYAREITS
jgi:eukaryotic-like serine/threonine-protein kinase